MRNVEICRIWAIVCPREGIVQWCLLAIHAISEFLCRLRSTVILYDTVM